MPILLELKGILSLSPSKIFNCRWFIRHPADSALAGWQFYNFQLYWDGHNTCNTSTSTSYWPNEACSWHFWLFKISGWKGKRSREIKEDLQVESGRKEGRSCFTKTIIANNITLKDEQMNQAEAYQLLPDLKKRKVFIQSNPYYSYYRESSNKRPKISLYFCIFTKARKSSWSRLASLAFLLR